MGRGSVCMCSAIGAGRQKEWKRSVVPNSSKSPFCFKG